MPNNQTWLPLLQELVAIDTSCKSGLSKAKDLILKWATQHSIHCRQIKGTQALLLETNPNLPKHFSFVTHLDVVPADDWDQAFTPTIVDDILFGRGVVDDKGPLSICLDLLRKNKNLEINVSCLIVTDEETINQEIHHIIQRKLYRPDFALVVDGGELNFFDIGQKGNLSLSVEAHTPGGHSAFETKGANAANVLTAFIAELNGFATTQKKLAKFTPAFINISDFQAHSLPYSMMTQATAKLQILFPAPQKSSVWLNHIEKLKKKFHSQGLINTEVHWKTEPHLLKNKKWQSLLKINPQIQLITSGGNNLAKDLFTAGIAAASHCPTQEYMAHCQDERIALSDLEKGAKYYQSIINTFTHI